LNPIAGQMKAAVTEKMLSTSTSAHPAGGNTNGVRNAGALHNKLFYGG
jgi:hypothetical protein